MIKRFGVSIPADLLKKLDSLVAKKKYPNRSEAIRDLIRNIFVEEEWQNKNNEVIGTITIVYNHDNHVLSQKLTDLQHSHYKNIISTLHVHLDTHNCLEVLIVKGKSLLVKEMADTLISSKGVKHGKVVTTTTGRNLS